MMINDILIDMSNSTPHYEIDRFVIMPNHIHLIIFLNNDEKSLERLSIQSIVRYMKNMVFKQCKDKIWHKSFYDRIIRNEKEYYNFSNYIIHNPLNWINDEYFKEQ